MPWIFDMNRWPKGQPMYQRPWWFLPAIFVGVGVVVVLVLVVIDALAG